MLRGILTLEVTCSKGPVLWSSSMQSLYQLEQNKMLFTKVNSSSNSAFFPTVGYSGPNSSFS